jgi:tetratricopeptide (TPR) repeat protein
LDHLWQKYFDSDYTTVLDETLKYMASSHTADYLHLTGLSLIGQKKIDEGRALLLAASTLMPSQVSWFSNAAVTLLTHDPESSLQFSISGIAYHPDNSELYFHQGNALTALRKFDEGLVSFDKSLSIAYSLDVLLNKGNCYRKMERQNDAIPCYEEILRADPDNRSALLGKAVCFVDQGRIAEAEPLFEKILDIPEAAFLYGVINLAKGNFKTGWKYYDQRWHCGFAQADYALYKKPFPENLSQIKGKTVLLVHEQGYGDTLQFIRFLPMLKQHAKRVIVVIPKTLIRLLQRMDNTVEFIHGRPSEDLYDYEIPMMNQASLFGINATNIPSKPYLTSPIIYLPYEKLRVGLCWAGGNATPNVNARRSMKLKQFLPLKDIKNVEFFSLQLGGPEAELDEIDWLMHRPLKKGFDYLDTANVISGLDLVIAVDTSVAHLAAAMGKPTWILSRHDACWRWLHDRSDSPWYPTVKLYRQPPPPPGQTFSKDWDTIVQAVTHDLSQRVKQTKRQNIFT